MIKTNLKHQNFYQNLKKLGFDKNDDCLFLTNSSKALPDPQIQFHIEQAIEFEASAVYLRKQLNGSYKPQVYLFDFTDRGFNKQDETELTKIQKRIWSSGEAPLACVFYNTEIKILDCTTHINDDYTPVHLIKDLNNVGKAHHLYNEQFALKIKSGVFWEEEELKNRFKFQNSSYDKLIENIKHIIAHLRKNYKNINSDLINKLIIQSILIKYLEERIDNDGNKLLSDKYFKKYDNSKRFNDVLTKGKLVELLIDLNDPKKGFNGNVFSWTNEEQAAIKKIDLNILAELLETDSTLKTGQKQFWRYFEFKYIPVELISRLYEEFLGEDKKDKGMFYTPSHLAKLLVDEAIPLKQFHKVDLKTYQILDPACGSGIFLVVAFKRLVQIWRLQNKMQLPELEDLKKLLLNVYGVDKEEQAVNLASFSLCLALCNELEPIDIINKLKFDDLRENNLIKSDFFECGKFNTQKFDLIIGNPPFVRGGTNDYKNNFWEVENNRVEIPSGQIALKFLAESYHFLKPTGLQCLIIKSSSLLYNSTSTNFKRHLFSHTNIIQILDFTALARNRALWDNGADVASAAIFIKKDKPNPKNNILHVTFRRTKATKERIAFEIDDYDLHFVNRHAAISNNFIWKNNLLGGGRVKSLIEKYDGISTFGEYLKENNCLTGEGFIIGKNGKLNPSHLFTLPYLPTEAISENGIDYSKLSTLDKKIKFVQAPEAALFTAPNILLWENIGQKKIPIFLNKTSFSYKDKIIGIASKNKDTKLLESIIHSFENNSDFYRFYIYSTSSQVLINRNTAVLKADFMRLPYISDKINIDKSSKVIADVNSVMRDFLVKGETSEAVKPINAQSFKTIIKNYGKEFVSTLNLIYEDKKIKFRLSDVVTLNNSFIATIFKYDTDIKEPIFHSNNSNLNLKELSDIEISKNLTVNRIIKLYPQKDTIVFIKPNQYRYWLSLTAYRDADKCFADLSNVGF